MAEQYSLTEKNLLAMLHNYVERQFLGIVEDFRLNPGGENWTRLEAIMWAWQAVNGGGLPKSDLLIVINTKPVTHWVAELTKRQKGENDVSVTYRTGVQHTSNEGRE